MRYLILGGGGFIGSHLCDELLSRRNIVRVFERPNLTRYRSFNNSEQLEWFEGDFTNKTDIREAVRNCDVIYHLISTTLPKNSNDNPIFDIESNVISTLNLLDAATSEKISKIIFASSGGTVYGSPKQNPVSESHPTDPIVSYGIGKLAVEKYLHLYYVIHGMDYCVLRLANPYGERQKINTAQGAVGVFLYKALHHQTIDIWGDGNIIRDYIYIKDVISALLKASSYNGHQRVFNIGSGEGRSLNQILDFIESLLGQTVNRRYLPGRPFDVPINVLDITSARTHLDWAPETEFIKSMQMTLDWYKKSGILSFPE